MKLFIFYLHKVSLLFGTGFDDSLKVRFRYLYYQQLRLVTLLKIRSKSHFSFMVYSFDSNRRVYDKERTITGLASYYYCILLDNNGRLATLRVLSYCSCCCHLPFKRFWANCLHTSIRSDYILPLILAPNQDTHAPWRTRPYVACAGGGQGARQRLHRVAPTWPQTPGLAPKDLTLP